MPISANDLRWLGEKADGFRGKEFRLVWTGTELLLLEPSDPRAADSPISVEAPIEGRGLLGGATVDINYNKVRVGPDPAQEAPDAIFLTQSAVAKFVFPYYTRMQTPLQIQDLKERLFAPNIVAVTHVAPSTST